jgi:flagellar hook-associated protein 3 FlgL
LVIAINTAPGNDGRIIADLDASNQLVLESGDGTAFTVDVSNPTLEGQLGIADGDSSAQYLKTPYNMTSSSNMQGPFNQLTTTRTGNNVKNIDFFGVMDQLISAVEGGDVDGISDIMLGKLNNWLNTLLKTRAQVGALTNRYTTTESRYVSNNTNYTELHSQTVGVDLAETITQYEMASSIYEASLASIARIMQVTLLDFLR